MSGLTKVRIDKWLWSVRVFKTRSLATTACAAGKVKINGKSMKPSFNLKGGETITIRKGPLTIIYTVLTLIEKRVSAQLAAECYEDSSPPPPPKPTFGKKDAAFFDFPVAYRKRGDGRPTKKERRDIDKLQNDSWGDWKEGDEQSLNDD